MNQVLKGISTISILFGTTVLANSRVSFPLPNTKVKPANIRQALPSRHLDSTFPKSLQGIWWMKDSPTSGLVSLARSHWNASENKLTVALHGGQTYTYMDHETSDLEVAFYKDKNVNYEVSLNPEHTSAVLRLKYDLHLFDQVFKITIPRFIIDYSMAYDSHQGRWLRTSKILGIPVHSYHLTRVVSEEGELESSFGDFLSAHSQPDEHLVVIQP